ncbi:HlyD family secretion protein [Pseudomonas songnenensis]|uniref:HlyD family efflux transporter periplasmic adaptor subunit n=1 Tax=Pseudomonas songnenensis TaxID=1176259 RepID=A0A482UKA6_9PSED|nr:HlyD family efflux transporter periplasmic adaptor subunit [Pseudomonas songnenensis]RYJ64264.1 HlyD family efflux transporter periplasmic adaptor subunit [Pseudomonas songnenensis]
MKIKFSSAKEQQPTQEQGLQVLYAPGKRMAFRLRWYLILFAVVSPLLWLVTRWALALWLIEAPAQLHLPGVELRARDGAQVYQVLVQPGQRVKSGEALVRLDNPEWRARRFLLAAADAPGTAEREALERERALLESQLSRAQARVDQMQELFDRGAATRGELLLAVDQRDARLRDLYQLAQRTRPAVSADQRQRELERAWLDSRLQALELRAEEDGKVGEILVAPGENVGPGTPLLRLEREGEAQVWVYLDPRHAADAAVGKSLTLVFPDGSKRAAQVMQTVDDAASVPVELRAPFSAPTRSLRVIARVDDLPERWRIDRLGLKARFPHDWLPFD